MFNRNERQPCPACGGAMALRVITWVTPGALTATAGVSEAIDYDGKTHEDSRNWCCNDCGESNLPRDGWLLEDVTGPYRLLVDGKLSDEGPWQHASNAIRFALSECGLDWVLLSGDGVPVACHLKGFLMQCASFEPYVSFD